MSHTIASLRPIVHVSAKNVRTLGSGYHELQYADVGGRGERNRHLLRTCCHLQRQCECFYTHSQRHATASHKTTTRQRRASFWNSVSSRNDHTNKYSRNLFLLGCLPRTGRPHQHRRHRDRRLLESASFTPPTSSSRAPSLDQSTRRSSAASALHRGQLWLRHCVPFTVR